MTTAPRKIKVGLIVDEYFGAIGTAYGGYGMLARHYIAKYLPNEEIEVEVLLKRQEGKYRHPFAKKHLVDGVVVWQPPSDYWCRQWLDRRDYDVYLSIEMTHDLLKHEKFRRKRRLIHWIQDPTTSRDWIEVSTMNLFAERPYWNSSLYDLVNRFYQSGSVRFITQGYCLNEKAKDLYRLRHDVPIGYVPNPVEIDDNFSVDTHKKKDMILFLGRIESVKRGWLFCEIAKKMPEYDFYMLGQTFRRSEQNEKMIGPYRHGIPNLHFVGHVEGEQKALYLKDAKILVNTSIREGIPISYLETLAYGTLLVSGFNAENLPSKFGVYVGKVSGDGFDQVGLFIDGIRKIMSNEKQRKETARNAVAYVKENHSIKRFQDTMREIVREEAQKRREAM
ncbi:MAG: glycosyltransferase family 4 protein [Planctomycetaceae bacterium]|nr:glycosyltransferase family 4 protein [Planctomycetaceae bacterium]